MVPKIGSYAPAAFFVTVSDRDYEPEHRDQPTQVIASASALGHTSTFRLIDGAGVKTVRNGQYGSPAMRLVVVRCEVTYTGRLTAHLPEAVRLLMFKADGSFLVHDDAGGFRPLNRIRKEFRPQAG
jgi:Endonuclease NucS